MYCIKIIILLEFLHFRINLYLNNHYVHSFARVIFYKDMRSVLFEGMMDWGANSPSLKLSLRRLIVSFRVRAGIDRSERVSMVPN